MNFFIFLPLKEFKLNKSPIFEFFPAKGKNIGLISIPHSGEIIPSEFTEYLIEHRTHTMQDVDYRVHELVDIEKLNNAGISVLKANISRVCIDLNRTMEKCLLTWKKNSRGIEIVTNTPDQKATEDQLITSYYTPYYDFLKAALDQLKLNNKQVNFVDLHSMPSKATDYHLKINPNQKVERPSFCISDQRGETCSQNFIQMITNSLKEQYPKTLINDPYFGGHITIFVNQYMPDCNNIQIEINRDLYMNEDDIKLIKDKVQELKPNLTRALINLFKKSI